MNALITGAGGFLGRYLTEQLVARGANVVAFSRQRYPHLEKIGVHCLAGDIRNEETVDSACQGRDTVFHAAAVAGIWGPWEHYYGVNTLGTRNVIAGCHRHGVKRLVYTSSPSVTFDGEDQIEVDESAPYPEKWLCHYPHTKALAEKEVLAANGQNGLLTCALRPHLIWGPGDPHLIPRLLARARQKKLIRIGDGKNLVDIIYVENAATAHVLAAEALQEGGPVCGKAYFLSQGEPVNCWDWINQILDLAGLPPVRRSISYSTAWRLGAVMEKVYGGLRIKSEPRMTRFLAAQLAKSHYFNISAAKSDFGYSAKISTAEGMGRLQLANL